MTDFHPAGESRLDHSSYLHYGHYPFPLKCLDAPLAAVPDGEWYAYPPLPCYSYLLIRCLHSCRFCKTCMDEINSDPVALESKGKASRAGKSGATAGMKRKGAEEDGDMAGHQ